MKNDGNIYIHHKYRIPEQHWIEIQIFNIVKHLTLPVGEREGGKIV